MRMSRMRSVGLGLAFVAALVLSAEYTPVQLHDAVRANDIKTVRLVLNSDVNIDSRDANGRTALLIATRLNRLAIARLLIDAGADVNARDNILDTPFLYAGAEGRLEILKMTVTAGADLTSVNRYGGTALIPAAHHGHVETVRYLLTTDIDIDHINNLGWTALLEAVILGDGGSVYQSIVELLLQAGANFNISNREGISPLVHAKLRGHNELVRLLRQ